MKRILLFLALSANVLGADFYVDGDWNGAQNGTPSQPWKLVNWGIINSSLANGPVTVYFSAREANSDTDDKYDNGTGTALTLDCNGRTSTSPNRLTLSANEKWNTSDTSPSWQSYNGNSKCEFKKFNMQGNTTKRSNITIRGARVKQTSGDKAVALNGDNLVLEYCDISHTSSATDGPCVMIVPTADAAHEGSSAFAARCTNIVIQFCAIHDTYGEALYIGGGGSNPGSSGSGYPSHRQVSVIGCDIYNAGRWGAQGDGIDVKGGIELLTIRSNLIHNVGMGGVARAIVMQGMYQVSGDQRVIEANRIYNNPNLEDAAIAMANSWGVPRDTIVRNNIIYNNSRSGVKIYQSATPMTNANNTLYLLKGPAIEAAGGVTLIALNNLFVNCNSGGSQVSYGSATVVVSDYNGYSSSIGYSGEGSHSFATTASVNFIDAATFNLHLLPNAAAKDKGATLAYVPVDADGLSRPQGSAYDLGAYEIPGGVVVPLISLSWEASPGATNYAIYSSVGTAPFAKATNTTATTVQLPDSTNIVRFQVSALGKGGESGRSNTVTNKAPTPQPPPIPQNLNLEIIGR